MGCYLYKLIDSQDANRLIQRLAAIRANVHLKLSPAREAGALGFTTHMKVGNDHAAVFSLGNQRVLDEWFAQRTRAQPGRGKTGVRPAANPSVALTPTLTLFAGHPAIDLTKLEIPARLQVSADLPDAVRKEKAGDPTLRAIDAFVAQHQAKKKTSDGASEVK